MSDVVRALTPAITRCREAFVQSDCRRADLAWNVSWSSASFPIRFAHEVTHDGTHRGTHVSQPTRLHRIIERCCRRRCGSRTVRARLDRLRETADERTTR